MKAGPPRQAMQWHGASHLASTSISRLHSFSINNINSPSLQPTHRHIMIIISCFFRALRVLFGCWLRGGRPDGDQPLSAWDPVSMPVDEETGVAAADDEETGVAAAAVVAAAALEERLGLGKVSTDDETTLTTTTTVTSTTTLMRTPRRSTVRGCTAVSNQARALAAERVQARAETGLLPVSYGLDRQLCFPFFAGQVHSRSSHCASWQLASLAGQVHCVSKLQFFSSSKSSSSEEYVGLKRGVKSSSESVPFINRKGYSMSMVMAKVNGEGRR